MSARRAWEVRWSHGAAKDLEEIGAFLARDDVNAALRTMDALEAAAA